MRWIVGLAFALVLGQVITGLFLSMLRKNIGLTEKPRSEDTPKRIPPWVTGTVERLVFTIFVGINAAAAPTAMIAWLALKLATNWNHPQWHSDPQTRIFAFSALLAGLISLTCAYVGGLIANGQIYVGI